LQAVQLGGAAKSSGRRCRALCDRSRPSFEQGFAELVEVPPPLQLTLCHRSPAAFTTRPAFRRVERERLAETIFARKRGISFEQMGGILSVCREFCGAGSAMTSSGLRMCDAAAELLSSPFSGSGRNGGFRSKSVPTEASVSRANRKRDLHDRPHTRVARHRL